MAKANNNKKPHLNPKNGRRKSALELLKKQIARGGYTIFGNVPTFIKYTKEQIEAKQAEIKTLESRIVI